MPIFILAILGSFFKKQWAWIVVILPWLVTKVLKLLGISVVTYFGLDLGFGALESWVFDSFSGLPTDMYSLLVLADIDWAIKAIISAAVSIVALKPMQDFYYTK